LAAIDLSTGCAVLLSANPTGNLIWMDGLSGTGMHITHRFMSSCTGLAGPLGHRNDNLDVDVQKGKGPPLDTVDT
jgi:hypothetical protein